MSVVGGWVVWLGGRAGGSLTGTHPPSLTPPRNRHRFVSFCSPSAAVCRSLAPAWEALARELLAQQVCGRLSAREAGCTGCPRPAEAPPRAASAAVQVFLTRVDVHSNPALAHRFEIEGLPTILLFRGQKASVRVCVRACVRACVFGWGLAARRHLHASFDPLDRVGCAQTPHPRAPTPRAHPSHPPTPTHPPPTHRHRCIASLARSPLPTWWTRCAPLLWKGMHLRTLSRCPPSPPPLAGSRGGCCTRQRWCGARSCTRWVGGGERCGGGAMRATLRTRPALRPSTRGRCCAQEWRLVGLALAPLAMVLVVGGCMLLLLMLRAKDKRD